MELDVGIRHFYQHKHTVPSNNMHIVLPTTADNNMHIVSLTIADNNMKREKVISVPYHLKAAVSGRSRLGQLVV